MQGLRGRLGVLILVVSLLAGSPVAARQRDGRPASKAPKAPVEAAEVPAAAEAPGTAEAPVAPPVEVAEPVEEPTPAERLIAMDFQDVDLAVLVKFISEMTGRNFIVDEKVKGKITIISPSKITVDEAYNVFQSVLQVKGFTTVPSGSIIKILPAGEAKSATLETVFPPGVPPLNDEFITRLMPLVNVDANNILPIIQPLISPSGLIGPYAATNTLILIDSASNIDRIARIIHELDVKDVERGVELVRLNYAFASEIAGTLAQVLEEGPAGQAPSAGTSAPRTKAGRAASGQTPPAAGTAPAGGGGTTVTGGGTGVSAFKIIPDERTNSLIIVAGALQMRKIKDLITRLDVPLPLGTGRIHVYYLKYANAFEIVPVLGDLIGGGGGTGPGGLTSGLRGRAIAGSTAFRRGGVGAGNSGSAGMGGFVGSMGGYGGGMGGFGSGMGGFGGGMGGGFGSRAARGSMGGGGLGGFGGGGGGGVSTASGGGSGEFEGEVRITADPSTNALLILASPQDFGTLKRVIELLDVRRRQVFVEAIILEVRLDKSRNLGIEMQGGTSINNGIALGRVNFGNINSALTNPASIPGLLSAAASNQTIRLPDGTVVPAQMALLTAAQSDSDVNLLSAPTILTTDNQEAEIVVGENLPFPASRSTSETNLSNTFATIERRDVGITLRITPQISEGGLVRMEIFQEVSAPMQTAVAGIDPNVLGPSTTIRSATTTVVVRDEQTVVIGGLISDGVQNGTQKVPFVSEIPVLGNLFRSTSSERKKVDLLIFLTPHIVRNAREHRDLSLDRRDKMKTFMQKQHFPNMRQEQLDMPSWSPELPAEESGEEKGGGAANERPGDEALSRRDTASPGGADRGQRPNPPVTNRYVLLASIRERGTPPTELQTRSGLLAVALPADSRLTQLFRKGGRFRYQNETFEGLYTCLEAYGTAQEALLIYPEGLTVDPQENERLHWRELKDTASTNVAAWTTLN